MLNKITDLYYKIIPYDWRPDNLWYSFTCWAFKHYTTVKPRWLSHGWCDKTALVPHLMFECLCNFIEKEKPFDTINWDWCEESKFARDEIIELYTWWLCIYIPWFQNQEGKSSIMTDETKAIENAWKIIKEFDNDEVFWSRLEKGEKGTPESEEAWKIIHATEAKMEADLKKNCHRLVEIFPFLWV